MRGRQIARIVFEHRGCGGVQTINGKDRLERRLFGFGAKSGTFYTVDRIKQPGQPTRGQDFMRIGFTSVGINNPPPRQRRNRCRQIGIGRKAREINIMHVRQIGRGIDVMFAHQAGKRGAVGVPIVLAQPVRLGPPDADGLHHPIGHPHLDLIKQAIARRVQGVVQIKDPSGDMCELLFDHAAFYRDAAVWAIGGLIP